MGYNVATKRKGIFVEKLKSYIKNNPIKIFIVFLTILVVVHYFFFLFGYSFNEGINENFYMDNNITLEKKGVWGDFSSGHFSILAFLWLAYGIYIQSQEFKLQREEFQNQTEQFKEQNKLYEQQMKELEIQSIQNQFDRKIAKLTEIEKVIANSKLANYDVYQFIMECKQNIELSSKFSKFDNIQKYIILYESLKKFILTNKHIIDLEYELTMLKKDIFDGLKISFLILLHNIKFYSSLSLEIVYRQKQFEQLKIYNALSQHGTTGGVKASDIIYKIIDEFLTIDDIDIFEKI